MEKEIVNEFDSYELERFHDDYCRALLRHHQIRLRFFFALQFPEEHTGDELDQVRIEQLDFRHWLIETPPDSVCGHRIFRKMIRLTGRLCRSAKKLHSDAVRIGVQENWLRELLREFHTFDQLSFRLGVAVTKSLADVDELTGLLNRTALKRDLKRSPMMKNGNRRPVTFAMVDLDRFKKVNDEFGHAFGDHVLETLAKRFCDSLRPGDQVYRYGGEEFLVFLPATSLEKAGTVLERLRKLACAREVVEDDIRIMVTVSIGAAQMQTGEEPGETMQRADEALYRAKEAGRNRVVLDRSNGGR